MKYSNHPFSYHTKQLALEKARDILYYSQVMKYAIIELAGRQFKISEGDVLEVTHQEVLSCPVLFYKDDSQTMIGVPYLEDVTVVLEKLEDKKDKKVVVARFKSKSRYRRKRGHRQPISVVTVKSIDLKSAPKKETIKEEMPVEKKKTVKKAVKKKEEVK